MNTDNLDNKLRQLSEDWHPKQDSDSLLANANNRLARRKNNQRFGTSVALLLCGIIALVLFQPSVEQYSDAELYSRLYNIQEEELNISLPSLPHDEYDLLLQIYDQVSDSEPLLNEDAF